MRFGRLDITVRADTDTAREVARDLRRIAQQIGDDCGYDYEVIGELYDCAVRLDDGRQVALG